MVRSALTEDTGWILELEKSGFTLPREHIDTVDFVVDDEYRGYADMKVIIDEGYIGNVYVRPEFRRQGIAGELISSLIERARSDGLSFITLEVRQSNSPAIALYEKYGFRVEGVLKNHYCLPKEDGLIMTARDFS